MSKYFEKVATPAVQGRQFRHTGPSVDTGARQARVDERTSGVGGAIKDLLGIATGVASIKKTVDAHELKTLDSKFGALAKAKTQGYGQALKMGTQLWADNRGMEVHDLTPEQLLEVSTEVKSNFLKDQELGDVEYLPLLDKNLDDMTEQFIPKQTASNLDAKREFAYSGTFAETGMIFDAIKTDPVSGKIDQASLLEAEENIMLILENRVSNGSLAPEDLDKEIQDTFSNALQRQAQSWMTRGLRGGDSNVSQKIEGMTRLFANNKKDVRNIVDMVRKKEQSALNKQQQMNLDETGNFGYIQAKNNMLKTEKDVHQFMKHQKDKYRRSGAGTIPDEESWDKLTADLVEQVNGKLKFNNLADRLRAGDSTAFNSLPKKEYKATVEDFFSEELGITSLTSSDIEGVFLSGKSDAQFKKYVAKGYPMPEAISDYFATTPVMGTKDKNWKDPMRRQGNALTNMIALTQDTPTQLGELIKGKDMSKIIYTSNIIQKVDSEQLNAKDAQSAMEQYNLNLGKNTNSFGVFTSPKSAQSMTDERKKELKEWSLDAPRTTDDYNSPEFMERRRLSNYNLMIDAGYEPDKAWDLSEDLTEGANKNFENPDGTESVKPREFMQFDFENDRTFDALKDTPEMQIIRREGRQDNSEFNPNKKLSFRVHPNYEQNKLMQVYYDDAPVFGLAYSAKGLEKLLENYKVKNKALIEKERELKAIQKKAELVNL